jgi:hypothetical protein
MQVAKLKYLLIMVLVSMSITGYSQFSGNNNMEVQIGNIPDTDPPWLISNYNQLNLQYRLKGFKAFTRVEYYITEFPERRYIQPSQLQLRYSKKSLQFTAGHYYEMLGNGLLLRAYDIPGSVFESQGYRVRHGFYRDLLGVSGGYQGERFHLKALYGKPLVNVLPPTLDFSERRIDNLYAVNTGYAAWGQNLSVSYLLNAPSGMRDHFGSVNLSGSLPMDFSYNTEVATAFGTGQPLFSGEQSRHAIYVSLVYAGMNLGGSLEWKGYHNFFLGSGFNDPPTLVKEHSYKVLNRSTHITQLTNERGYQLEVYYRFNDGKMVTLNTSRARNEFYEVHIFQEYFAELYAPLGESASVKWFIDYARDPFKEEPNRYATGGIYETVLVPKWSSLLQLEYQYFERDGLIGGSVHNAVLIAGVNRGSKLSISVTWEVSTDPYLTDNINTFEIEKQARHWIGMDARYRFNRHHTLALFAGQRRGGPACTSGICYEVLDFQGVELRWISKF